MATIYGKASDLIETLDHALKQGEPMINLGPELMQTGLALMAQALLLAERSISTLDRCDRVLDRLDALLVLGDSSLETQRLKSALELRKLTLEVEALERAKA